MSALAPLLAVTVMRSRIMHDGNSSQEQSATVFLRPRPSFQALKALFAVKYLTRDDP